MRVVLVAALALAAACGRERRATAPPAEPPVSADASAPPDSLAVRGPDGIEVWFTLAREDHAADGTPCTDRAIEIRRGGSRVAVPLLYTRLTPRFVNDTTVEATLFRACAPVDRYRVDVRTGHPTPVRGG